MRMHMSMLVVCTGEIQRQGTPVSSAKFVPFRKYRQRLYCPTHLHLSSNNNKKSNQMGILKTKIVWQANQGVRFVSYMFLMTGLFFAGSLTYACLRKHNETSRQYKVKRSRSHATRESSDATYSIIETSKFCMHYAPRSILHFDHSHSPLFANFFREKTCFSCIYRISRDMQYI